MTTQQILITPAKAAELIETLEAAILSGKTKQRRINNALVEQIASDIRANRWRTTHQGIAFDTNNNLIDGQHRLRAIIKANKSVKIQVTYGLDSSDIECLDIGLMRPLWQQLQLCHDYTNSSEHVAMVRTLIEFVYPNYVRISPAQTIEIYDKTGLHDVVTSFMNLVPKKEYRRAPVIVPVLMYHEGISKSKAREFLTKFYTLELCEKDDPALALNRYQTSRNLRPRKSRINDTQVTCNCIQAYHNNTKIITAKPSRESQVWLLNNNEKLVKYILKIIS